MAAAAQEAATERRRGCRTSQWVHAADGAFGSEGFPRGEASLAILIDESRLKLSPWQIFPGRAITWLRVLIGKIFRMSQGEFDS